MTVKRAYDTVAKEARRQAILEAADRLFATSTHLPSANQIAEAAGLAKGTVYLYFRTKEEIFAFLLLEGWSRMMDAAGQALKQNLPREQAVEAFIAAFTRELCQNTNLLRLDALGKALLEANMTPSALSAFKSQFCERLEAEGAMFETTLVLPAGRGAQLLIRTHALTRGLWQSFGFSQHEGPGVQQAIDAFSVELQEALAEYWRGALGVSL